MENLHLKDNNKLLCPNCKSNETQHVKPDTRIPYGFFRCWACNLSVTFMAYEKLINQENI